MSGDGDGCASVDRDLAGGRWAWSGHKWHTVWSGRAGGSAFSLLLASCWPSAGILLGTPRQHARYPPGWTRYRQLRRLLYCRVKRESDEGESFKYPYGSMWFSGFLEDRMMDINTGRAPCRRTPYPVFSLPLPCPSTITVLCKTGVYYSTVGTVVSTVVTIVFPRGGSHSILQYGSG